MNVPEIEPNGVYIIGDGGFLLPYRSQRDTYIQTAQELEQVIYSHDDSLIGTMPASRIVPDQPHAGNMICDYFDTQPYGSLKKLFDAMTPNIGWKGRRPPRTPEESYAITIVFRALQSAGITPELFDETVKWLPKKEAKEPGQKKPLVMAVGVTNSVAAIEVITKAAREGLTPKNVLEIGRSALMGNINAALKGEIQFTGSSFLHAAACATTLFQFDQALDKLQSGQADLAIVGGFEIGSDYLLPYALGNTPAYADYEKYKDNPEEAVRPGDVNVQGMAITEGGGCFVVATGATIYRLDIPREKVTARVVSAATGHDDARFVPPAEPQIMPMLMKRTIERTGLHPTDIDVVIPHGTGTQSGDVHDWKSQRIVFGLPERQFNQEPDSELAGLPFTTEPKSKTGHALGGSGALSIRTMIDIFQRQEIPPTRNITKPHGIVFNLVHGENRPHPVRRGLIVAYGISGEAGVILLENVNTPL